MASKMLEEIKKMSVVQLASFIKEIEEEFDVSASAAVAVAPAAASGAVEAGLESTTEEKTEFKVTLKESGSEKIKVIKALRSVTDRTLKDARDMVESFPCVVAESVSKEDAQKMKEALEAAGAKVELS